MAIVDLDGTVSAPPQRLTPKFEWKDEGASHVLYVYLPGFIWKDLTLTSIEPTRTLNVRGTHTIQAYYFIWFDIDIRIPDSARFKEMRSRFQKETLIVTFPKQTLVSPPPPPLPPPPPPPPPPQAKDPVPIPTPQNEPPPLPHPPPRAKDPIPIPTLPNEPSPPQAKESIPIVTPRNEPPPPQATEPVPIPTPHNEPMPPPLPPPSPPQAKDPIPIQTPHNEPPKVEERINEGPSERESHVKLQPLGEKGAGSGGPAAMIHSPEMKVGMEEQRKLMVNVLMAAIVLVAIGAYIYATLTRRDY